MNILKKLAAILLLVCLCSGASQAETWRYFTHELYQNKFLEPPDVQGSKLCAIEGWTAENSGFPSNAADWSTTIFPSGQNNPNALRVVLDSIDAVPGGFCEFVAVPWYAPEIHATLIEHLTLRRLVPIPWLEGSAEQATAPQTAALSEDKIKAKTDEALDLCGKSPYGSQLFNCSCIANEARRRFSAGELSTLGTSFELEQALFRDPTGRCVNQDAIRQTAFENCENFKRDNSYNDFAQTLDCNCVQEQALEAFLKAPGYRAQSYALILRINASCYRP